MSKHLILRARIAEEAERYDDMVEFMTEYVQSKEEPLPPDERNLLSVAYKNKIGSRRSCWRIVSLEVDKETDEEKLKIATDFRAQIESELNEIYKDIVNLIDNHLIPQADEHKKKSEADADGSSDVAEEKVFYYKMKADYCRYKAEYSRGDEKKKAVEESEKAYKIASDTAEESLSVTHPIRLGLSLNYSVFHYEIKNDPEKACSIAKQAFDSAITDLDSLNEDIYKDSTLIMQLLRDNLTLWTSDLESANDAGGQLQVSQN